MSDSTTIGVRVGFLCAGLVFLSAFFHPPEAANSGEGKVVGATVYRDRALVVRSLDVDLAEGSNRIEVTGLPADLDQDSLRIAPAGDRADSRTRGPVANAARPRRADPGSRWSKDLSGTSL